MLGEAKLLLMVLPPLGDLRYIFMSLSSLLGFPVVMPLPMGFP